MSLLPKSGRTPRPGCLVEFLQGNEPQPAWVLEEQSGRLRLYTLHKRETKLAAARVLPWIGPEYQALASRQEIEDRLNAHQARRTEIQSGIDVMELWELAQGEMEAAPVEWFAGLVFPDPGPDELAAMGRAMLAAKTHFKFRPPDFEIHPADKVEARLAQQAEEARWEEVSSTGQALFHAVWHSLDHPGKAPLPPVSEAVADQLKTLLGERMAGREDEKSNRLWAAVTRGLPEHPCQAQLLAQGWGLVSRHHNAFLDEADYSSGDAWAEAHQSEVEDILRRLAREAGPVEELSLTSVDAATTRDIDDAFHIRGREDGGYVLTLALARPSAVWDFGSPLDAAVAHRASSLYLPEGSSHMMPEVLATEGFSLKAGQVRPALLAEFHLSADGTLEEARPRRGFVRLTANRSYEEVEKALEEGSDPELALARDLSEKLLSRRLERGAVVLRKPEPRVVLSGDPLDPEVHVEIKAGSPAAELLVSEFMILANHGLAAWAGERGVALLHRTQDIALPSNVSGIFSEPQDVYQAMRLLAAPVMETTPRRHSSLGVPAYAPATSPIRRYADLLNMAQIDSFLDTGEARLTAAELEALIPVLNMRIQAVAKVQRARPRYWKLVHLSRNRKTQFEAVAVDEAGMLGVLALPLLQMTVRAPKKILGDKLYPGKRFLLTFGRCDPLIGEIRVSQALEE